MPECVIFISIFAELQSMVYQFFAQFVMVCMALKFALFLLKLCRYLLKEAQWELTRTQFDITDLLLIEFRNTRGACYNF